MRHATATSVWRPDLSARHYGRERIEHVAFVPMPAALRNELITEAYGDLADAMRMVLGSDDATWCTFGQWASHAVGDVLRLPGASVGRLIAAAFGDGNRSVFADVGRAHAIFLETVGVAAGVGADLDAAWDRCATQLLERSPAPPSHPMQAAPPSLVDLLLGNAGGPDATGRVLLLRGFQAYRDALDCHDPAQRSRTILLGNALLAVHEQQRLGEAITIGFRSWLRTLTTAHVPLRTRYRWRNTDPRHWRLRLEDRWIDLATRRLVGIDLPDRRIDVGRPLPLTTDSVEIPPLPAGIDPAAPAPPLDEIATDDLLAIVYDTFRAEWPSVELLGRSGRPDGLHPAHVRQRTAVLCAHRRCGLSAEPVLEPSCRRADRFEQRLNSNDPAITDAPRPRCSRTSGSTNSDRSPRTTSPTRSPTSPSNRSPSARRCDTDVARMLPIRSRCSTASSPSGSLRCRAPKGSCHQPTSAPVSTSTPSRAR
ncbi:MAG: hypothetical protein R2710_28950 [Acidimicrobiales bacterium]